MTKVLIVLSMFAVSFSAISASAKCARGNEVVTLEGVVTLSATYVSPKDFGWAPKNGFVSYPVLVISSPVCLDDDGQISDEVRVLQLSSPNLPSIEAMRKGVSVRVKGILFPEHTAHHFTSVLLNVSEITILN